jgi:hypothetical protein
VFGGWFSELYIGGGSPVNAPLYATNAGVVIIGGFEYFQGQPYAPYISIRRNTGQEVGRIGARIARNTDGSTLVPNGDPADIAGAWFNEFAVGGSNLSDWRILARRDATNPTLGSDLVNIRNINKFTIDYLQNYNPSGSYPNNEAVHLEFGYDAFMVDNAAPSAWKFPGIKIQRSISGTPTTHGSMLITRGLILYGPSSQRKAALVSWNGDQNGNPDTASTWWGELSLYAPNANGTVLLTGGSASDVPLPGQPGSSLKPGQSPTGTASAAFFRMMNESAQTNFYVDQRGNVYCRGYCDVTETLTAKAISTAGFSLTGGGAFSLGSSNVTTTGTVQAGTLTVTGNATVSGNITCTGANPNGVIEARVLKGAHTSGSVDVSTVKASGAITGGSFNVGSTAALDTAGHYIGPQISTGQINGARIITDTAFAVKQFTPPFYKDVINSAGVFVGPSINTPGSIAGASLSISGATTFAGELGAGSFKAGTNVVINAAGAFVGKGVSCPSDGIGGLSLGIWTGSVYEYGINVPGTAPAGGPGNTTDTYLLTNDGKRARVRGGLVVEIL